MKSNVIFKIAKSNDLYFSILVSTIIFFLFKGITYLFLFRPLTILITLTIGLSVFTTNSIHKLRRAIKIWSGLLMLWSSIRLTFYIVDSLFHKFDESHVYEQISGFGLLLSTLIFLIGLYLFNSSSKLVLSKNQ